MTTSTVSDLATRAAKAQADADRLAAQAADLDSRQQAASHAAEVAAWNEQYKTRADHLGKFRDDAQTAWQAVAANPKSTLDDLFAAFAGLKAASAVNYAARVEAANRLDTIDKRVSLNHIGVDTSRNRPRPAQDPMAQTTFTQALEEALAPRTKAAVAAEQHRAAIAVRDAVSAAVSNVH